MNVVDYAKKIGRSRARVYILLQTGRISKAKIDDAGNWIIPQDAKVVLKRRGRKVSKRCANAIAKS
jgi:hypothetical protein